MVIRMSFCAEELAAVQVFEAADSEGMACTTKDSQCNQQAACREDTEF